MLNLGGLFFTLDADTRGLAQAQRKIETFAGDVRKAFRSMENGKLAPNIANQLARQERSVVSFMERIKKLQNLVGSTSGKGTAGINGEAWTKAREQLAALTHQYDVFVRKMASGVPLNALDFGRRTQHMKSQLDDTTRSLNKLITEAQNKTGWGNAIGNMHKFGNTALVVQGHFGGLSTRLFAFGNLVRETNFAFAAGASVIAGLSAGLGVLTTSAITAGKAMERLSVGFKALEGNAAVAATDIAFTKDVANQAGLVFDDTAKAYMRFLASAKGNISLKATKDVFRGISLAAATMQLSVEDTQGVFRALDQMMSKGTVQAEELRGQLGDRLPGAFKVAAAAMGVSTKALGEMMKKGQVMSADFVPKFTKTLMAMWNIDPSKSINTLQASISRLGNEWTYFSAALDQATGASKLFKSMVDGLVTGMQSLRENLPQILSGIGALASAFTGLAVSMAVQALVGYVANLWNMVAVYTAATRAVSLAATAQNLFNVAIANFPAARVIGIIANLVITVGSAVVGYKLMKEAVEGNNRSLADLSATEAYIKAQKAMGFAVRETTQDMIKQMQVQLQQMNQKNLAALPGLMKAAEEVDRLQKATANSGRGSAEAGTVLGMRRSDFQSQLKDVREGTALVKRMSAALKGLAVVAKLPETPLTPQAPTGTGGSDGDKTKDSIDNLEDYILKMKEAEAMLKSLAASPADQNLVESLYEAKRAINGLNPAQLTKLGTALDQAGISGSSLEERLGVVFQRTKNATDAAKDFGSAWADITKEGYRIATFRSQIDYLLGGGSPEGLDLFKDLEDAKASLKNLTNPEALTALQDKLSGLGIPIQDMGNELDTTAMALARFYREGSRTQDLVREWTKFNEEVRHTKEALTDMQVATAGFGVKGFKGIFAEDIGNEAKAATERGRKVGEYRRSLIGLGQDQATVNAKVSEYLQLLRDSDDAAFGLQRIAERAAATKEMFKGMFTDASAGFRDVIMKIKDMNDMLYDFAMNTLSKLWDRFVSMPIDQLIDGIGRRTGKSQTAGLDTLTAGLPANDNAASVTNLAQAANKAAASISGNLLGTVLKNATANTTMTGTMTAFQSSVMAATAALNTMAASSGGSGGGGIFGKLFSAVAGGGFNFGSAASSGAASVASSAMSGISAALKATSGARALGGAVTAGSVYRVNEAGVNGEFFIPAVNGYMARNDNGGGGNGPAVHIDASTTIDARGASVDAVAELKAMAAARDAQLRKELPYMIDSRVRESSGRGRYG